MATLLSIIRDSYLRIKALLKDLAEYNADLTALEASINASPGIPVSNPTTSFWLQNPPFPDLVDMRSKTLPKTADIVIIGSGITGASVARTILSECASMGINRRVVMLEARQICSGATGRNGGHIKCTPYESSLNTRNALELSERKRSWSFRRLISQFWSTWRTKKIGIRPKPGR